MTPALVSELALEENILPSIAHEIRQPLSAIESIAYYISLLHGDDKHREQLQRIQQLVEQSNWILSSGLALADQRQAAPEAVDLHEMILAAASRLAPSGPRVKFDLGADLPLVHLDPGFGRTLIENLICLFRQVATASHPVELRTQATENGVEIEMFTAATGYRSVETLPPGSALSLDSMHRIVTMHDGIFTHSIDPLSGIRVCVVLP
jgi:signal transduction histidine kinase